MPKPKKVFVMMSGGVDSSLSAALLKEQGHDVVGVFMKNWSESIPGVIECTTAADADDARAVAVHLDIPFYVWDFESEYKKRVFEPMIEAYRAGLTPNPDVNCNSEVKFALFLGRALEAGADLVASGHYVRVEKRPRTDLRGPRMRNSASAPKWDLSSSISPENTSYHLLAAVDKNKDQSYFLNRLTSVQLSKTLFPIGDMAKSQVREGAAKRGLITATKKDSQGLCFVGQVSFKEVLKRYIPSRVGKIMTIEGEAIGEHDGAEFVTIGQRNGLGIGGGIPYFVVDKDVANNVIYVVRGFNNPAAYSKELFFTDASWVVGEPELPKQVEARIRYRGPLELATLYPPVIARSDSDEAIPEIAAPSVRNDNFYRVEFADAQKAITPGQSVVLYDGEEVLGGGVIERQFSVLAADVLN